MATARPDAASVADSFVPTHHKGLTYPFGPAHPGPGAVIDVAPGLRWVRLAIPGPLKHVNCWLIDDDDGAVLVDTGMDQPDTRAAWDGLFAGPLAGLRVTRLIGTHCHPDHIGLAGWIAGAHSCPLVMTRGEWLTVQHLRHDARDAIPDEVVAMRVAAGWSAAQIDAAAARGWAFVRRIVAPLSPSYTRIADGDGLAIGARTWRIVTGSGHSPEHACLLDEANGVFVSGDQVLPRISSNVSLGITEPEADPLGEWLASIARLKRAVPADVLVLPGHGDPFTGLHARLDALAAEHRARLDELEAFLAEPRRATDCFGRLFRRAIGQDQLMMATGEALAHLRRLEVEGRAARETIDGVWWWRAA